MESTAYYVIAGLLVGVGLLGTVLPVIPGTLLVFAGLFVAAWTDGFARVGPVGLGVIGLLGLLSLAVDFVASVAGARRVGASPQALIGATLGALVGFFFSIAGLILGPFIGAFAGELVARGGLRQAARVGFGTWLGLLAAAILKVVLAFLMIATFAAFYLLNA